MTDKPDLVERVRRAMHESGEVGFDDDDSERALARAAIATVLDDLAEPSAEACEEAAQIKDTEMNGPHRLSLGGWRAHDQWQAMLAAKRKELGL